MSDMNLFQPTAEGGEEPQWTFTDRLRKAREHAGLEQADLAALLSKKRSTISNWERGANRPDELALRAIAHYTGVSLQWLKADDEPDGDGGTTADIDAVTPGYISDLVPSLTDRRALRNDPAPRLVA